MKMDEISKIVETGTKETDQELEKLRSRHREEKLAYREHQREFILNRARFLVDEDKSNLANCDIYTLAKDLKTKSQVTCELLNTIMNKLNTENVEDFLNVDGALQSLLRILSGQNEKFQLIAAYCICKLALGNSKKSLSVLKASVSYLTAHLSGRNCYIKEACLIALGNFSKHGTKHIELLTNQKVLFKLIHLISDSDTNLESSAIYALTQFVYHGFDILKAEDFKTILEAVISIFKIRSFSVAFLLSVLSSSSHTHSLFISHQMHKDVLNCLTISLKEEEKEAVFYLRILSNLIAEESGDVARSLIESSSHTVSECIRCLLMSEKEYLRKECLGFLGNLVNHPSEMCQIYGFELLKENFEKAEAHFQKFKAE